MRTLEYAKDIDSCERNTTRLCFEFFNGSVTNFKMSNNKLAPIKEAKETFQSLMELSKLLCTGLEPETLAICVRLCEAGVNPEVLASVVRELHKEIQQSTKDQTNPDTT